MVFGKKDISDETSTVKGDMKVNVVEQVSELIDSVVKLGGVKKATITLESEMKE